MTPSTGAGICSGVGRTSAPAPEAVAAIVGIAGVTEGRGAAAVGFAPKPAGGLPAGLIVGKGEGGR